jgi:two-component system, sensor histidine kinase and response regulator
MAVPMPENETERLAALRYLGILDTPPEVAYDELSALAAYVCQTPIALISLVDADRQWFKSRVGWTLGETPREVAFCAHAVVQPDLLVVPDARTDERFADNPLVTSPPAIRFYAGAPLVTTEGHALGTLCVLDHQPRELTQEQIRALRALSHQVVAQLRLRQQLREQRHINDELARANAALQAEVTLRQRAEEALRENERQFNSVLSELHGLAFRCLINKDWTCLYAAGRFGPIAGIEAEDLLSGRVNYGDIIHPEDAERYTPLILEAVRRREPFENEHRIFDRQGNVKWILSRGHGVYDEDGNYRFLEGLNIDITEQKRAREELRKVNDRLALAVRGSRVSVWENDMTEGDYRKGPIHCVNLMEQLGYPAPGSTLDYETVVAPILPEDREQMLAALQAYLAGQTPDFSVEFRAQHRDGSYRWMLSRGVLVRDGLSPDSKPVSFIGTRIDITELKETEAALRESEERFRGTFENAGVGIGHVDFDGRFLRLNEKHCAILGYSREELLRRPVQDITHPDDRPASLDFFNRLRRGELSSYSLEKRYIRKDGSPVWVDLSVSLQRDAAGVPIYIIGIIQDISERKRLECELRAAREWAEAGSRAKSTFLAHVSHEVRTPLNAILGMNELALDTSVSDQQRKYLTAVQSSAEQLLLAINDLLDFSKIEAGKVELEQGTFSLRSALLNETLRSLALRAHRKGLELVGRVHPDVPDTLVGDAGRLRQVLTNLVGNAVKFTEQGEVVVEVEVSKDESDLNRTDTLNKDSDTTLLFSVRDTGIGIPADKHQKIFEAFEQTDRSTTRRYGGTGLGLSIASRLVELMGGRISVESEPGRGSTFRFSVPLHQPPLQSIRDITPAELRGVPILILDDNATSCRTLEEWLRGWGAEPTAVPDGATALRLLREAGAVGRAFALVVLDSHLRENEARALAVHLRRMPELAASGILLLLAEGQAGELRHFHELGITAHVEKPVVEEELLNALRRLLTAGASFAPAVVARPNESPTPKLEEPAHTASGRRLHFLIAEDNPANQAYLKALLPRRGHTMHVAADGRAALAALEEDHYDVMLLDVHMPELSGFQVVAAQRQREQRTGKHLPIIAITALSTAGERENCLRAGMDEYLAKPVRAADLFAAIDRVLTGEGSRQPLQAETGAPPGLLDPATVLGACDGDDELLKKMCKHFQTFVPERLAELTEALRNRNTPRLREAAHKLGGMVSTFSATAAEAIALLGRLGKEERFEEATQTHSRLTGMVDRLTSVLNGLTVEQLRRWREDSDESIAMR